MSSAPPPRHPGLPSPTGAHRARKRFGQNFLVDRGVIERIVEAVAPRAEDRIVEIGPGHGALTRALLERVPSMEAVEIDRDLAAELERSYPPERLRVYVGDALRFALPPSARGLRIVGNLPYNISSPLLFKLLEHADEIVDIHVMLQKEVVDRMVAEPGGKDYGRLTVMLGCRFRVERLIRVGAGAFRPQPKVDSAFIRLRPRECAPWVIEDPARFAQVVALAFGQRRKTLRNALSSIANAQVWQRADIDPQARGETLTIAQFAALANQIGRQGPGAAASDD